MDIDLTTNKEDIMTIFKHPEIYACITDDFCPPSSEWDLDITGHELLIGKVNNKPMALMHFHPDQLGWMCHVQVLPDYREYSNEFGKKVLNWFWNNHKENDLYAEIPTKYPNVMRFAEKNGFKPIKVTKETYQKNNIKYDEITYKLERPNGHS